MISLLLALLCSITIEGSVVSGTCATGPFPPKPVDPVPRPTPTPTPPPTSGGTYKGAFAMGGRNNVIEAFDGETLVYSIPGTWPDGRPVTLAQFQFATRPFRNFGVETYEAAFSPSPGDFTYYKSHPECGKSDGFANFQLGLTTQDGVYGACKVGPGWYLNWRVVGCPAGKVCGNDAYSNGQ